MGNPPDPAGACFQTRHDNRSPRTPTACRAGARPLAAGPPGGRARSARAAGPAGAGPPGPAPVGRSDGPVPAAGTARLRGPHAPRRPERPVAAPGTAPGRRDAPHAGLRPGRGGRRRGQNRARRHPEVPRPCPAGGYGQLRDPLPVLLPSPLPLCGGNRGPRRLARGCRPHPPGRLDRRGAAFRWRSAVAVQRQAGRTDRRAGGYSPPAPPAHPQPPAHRGARARR